MLLCLAGSITDPTGFICGGLVVGPRSFVHCMCLCLEVLLADNSSIASIIQY